MHVVEGASAIKKDSVPATDFRCRRAKSDRVVRARKRKTVASQTRVKGTWMYAPSRCHWDQYANKKQYLRNWRDQRTIHRITEKRGHCKSTVRRARSKCEREWQCGKTSTFNIDSEQSHGVPGRGRRTLRGVSMHPEEWGLTGTMTQLGGRRGAGKELGREKRRNERVRREVDTGALDVND